MSEVLCERKGCGAAGLVKELLTADQARIDRLFLEFFSAWRAWMAEGAQAG